MESVSEMFETYILILFHILMLFCCYILGFTKHNRSFLDSLIVLKQQSVENKNEKNNGGIPGRQGEGGVLCLRKRAKYLPKGLHISHRMEEGGGTNPFVPQIYVSL